MKEFVPKETEYTAWIGEHKVTFRLDMRYLVKGRYTTISRRHCNTEYEFTLIRQGVCLVDVGENRYVLKAGQGILIPPGEFHILRAEPGAFDRFCVRFLVEDRELDEALRRRTKREMVCQSTDSLERLCTVIFDLYQAKTPYWSELFPSLLKALLLQVFGRLQLDWGLRESRPYVPDRMVTIERYIEQNMGQEPTLEELATILELSPRQLVRVLQEEFGTTFRQKLLHARMDRAAWLLRTSKLPVESIVGEVGYSSRSSFYQAFQRMFDLTPVRYREKFRDCVAK